VSDYRERLLRKLSPEIVSAAVLRASCFLSAYELIRLAIVGNLHDFYAWDERAYQREVRSRGPNPYRASCAWLVDHGVLTHEQVGTLDAVYHHRQEIAHELPRFAIDPDAEVNTDLLVEARGCLRSVCLFWGRITVDSNEEFDGQEIADEDIVSPMVSLLDYILDLSGVEYRSAEASPCDDTPNEVQPDPM
jgi:hypothetical protein